MPQLGQIQAKPNDLGVRPCRSLSATLSLSSHSSGFCANKTIAKQILKWRKLTETLRKTFTDISPAKILPSGFLRALCARCRRA